MILLFRNLLFLSLILLPYQMSFAADSFDHHYMKWGDLLKRYVKERKVDYRGIIKRDLPLFDSIVADLEKVSESEYLTWNKEKKMSFWINVYNIEAMKLVLDHYPLKRSLGLQALRYPANSIQQIPDVWNQEALAILGKKVSLNYIENEILRREFSDPRIHFAIVCASLGCPVLRDEPYVSDRLDSQLNDAVTKFLQDHRKFNYDARKNTFHLSPIFKWFKEDFEKAGGSIAFIKKYIPQDKNLPDSAPIQWLDYDWSLNEQ
ncbi:MAG: DUF547 domain-containing protein [Candidatus Omnitrophica bacterium]|nr:DUF547 domain-containing protein [Candidatus Omnitrophota bacterium]